jgi:hypothetical protein
MFREKEITVQHSRFPLIPVSSSTGTSSSSASVPSTAVHKSSSETHSVPMDTDDVSIVPSEKVIEKEKEVEKPKK